MRRAAGLLALLAMLGCGDLTEADAGVVAIEVVVPSPAVIGVGQTIQLAARALNRDGEPVSVEIVWRVADATLSIESATGLLTGVAAGTGRVQALSGSLASDLVTFTVVDPAATP